MYTKSHIKGELVAQEFEFKTVPDILKHYADKLKEEEAFVFTAGDKGIRDVVSWASLYEKSHNTAISLRHLGVKQGEFVAINLRCCPEWLYLMFGVMMAGAIPVTTAFVYSDGSDLVEVMTRLEKCSVLVMDPGLDGKNLRIVEKLIDTCNGKGEVYSERMPYLRHLVLHNPLGHTPSLTCISLKDLTKDSVYQDELELPDIAGDDVALLVQTSGSTGIAKLVAHTHKSILVPCKSDTSWFNADLVQFNDRPFMWMGGFPLSCLIGQKRVTLSGFRNPAEDPIAEMIEVIHREKCSLVFALPPLLHALMKQQDKLPADWPVEVIVTGGQPLTRSLAGIIGKACTSLSCAYGTTEFIMSMSMLVTDPENFTEYACGHLIQGPGIEAKIVDEEGEVVPVNSRGELIVRSPGMFQCYFNDENKTNKVKSKDGWFKTDDLGRMTADGLFFIDGRKSNMILSGGMNVLPEVMEQMLKSCPGVESVVVVPIPDDVNYQLICACVIPKPNSGLTIQQLRNFCEDKHNDKKGVFTVLPKFFILFEKFPETSTGKTSRQELANLATKIVKGLN